MLPRFGLAAWNWPGPEDPLSKAPGHRRAGLKKPWFDSAGVPIHYVVKGREDGEPVVLIHGFTSSIEAAMDAGDRRSQEGLQGHRHGLRGCGGSGKPHDPKKYGIEMINDVARLLDHLKIDKAHIVGYSMGAGIGLLLAVHHPERVRTLTCCGAGAVSFGSNTPPAGTES